MCRICFNSCTDEKNPLLSACNCMGTMKFVHLNCLKAWIAFKLNNKKLPTLNSYFWKSFECEICKAPFPCMKKSFLTHFIVTIKQNSHKYNLVDVEVPVAGNFLILESLNKDKNASRIIHIIKPNENKTTYKLVS
jgi:hypothetical protein